MTDMPRVLIFDVNETLLDLTPLKETVGAALGGRGDLLPLWFTTMLQYSLVDSLIGQYRDFAQVGVGALMMIGEKQGISIDRDTAEQAIIEPIRHLPAHPDVVPALESLRSNGFIMAALTNSSRSGVAAQLTNAGIIELFHHVVSTEEVQAFKPDPKPYRHALDLLETDATETLMVAAHAWDLAGAKNVGLQTAFIARPGAVLYPNVERPDIVVSDLAGLVSTITT
ncbi:MAG: haloacid dehalogenase type II [Acidimicrobiia bacterium]|nr:haloacid dehalogenase type II [Acidimicrobiia bacterium]